MRLCDQYRYVNHCLVEFTQVTILSICLTREEFVLSIPKIGKVNVEIVRP